MKSKIAARTIEQENELLKQQNADLLKQVNFLSEQIKMLRQLHFGRKSESKLEVIDSEQLTLFNEAEIESVPEAPEPELEQITYNRKKQKGKRELDFSGLPVNQIVHELPEDERICPDCGNPLHACGHDVLRRELTVIPARGIEYCDALFALEREYAKLPTDDDFKARYGARLKKSKPIMDEFFDWAEKSCSHILATPRSATGQAVRYPLNQRKYLENVLLDGRLELSNNRAERSIKPFVIGRKNWLFSNSERGANASSVIYSIIETAKENNLKPYEYLKFIFETAPNIDINNPETLEGLLPWNAPDVCRLPEQMSMYSVKN